MAIGAGCVAESPAQLGSEWKTDFETARKIAAEQGKPLLVDFYTDWCGYCRKLDRDVYSREAFRTKAESFVLVRVNPEKDAPSRALASRYGVQGFPTTVFVSPEGEKLHVIVGYRPLKGYLAEMDKAKTRFEQARGKKG